MLFYRWIERNDRSLTWFTNTSFVWCLSIRQSVLHISQIAFNGIRPPIFIQTRLHNNTAEVPSFFLRTSLQAIPLVSERCGVDVKWFPERSSHAFQTQGKWWWWKRIKVGLPNRFQMNDNTTQTKESHRNYSQIIVRDGIMLRRFSF